MKAVADWEVVGLVEEERAVGGKGVKVGGAGAWEERALEEGVEVGKGRVVGHQGGEMVGVEVTGTGKLVGIVLQGYSWSKLSVYHHTQD